MRVAVDLLQRATLGLVLLILRGLPPEAAARVLAGLGRLWWHADGRRRAIALENLDLALGECTDAAERRRIGRASFEHFGRVVAEIVQADRIFRPGGAARRRFRYEGAWDEALAATRAGQPGLLLSGHLGNWEAAAWAARQRGLTVRSIVRTLDAQVVDDFVTHARGGETALLRKWGAVRGTLRSLERGIWVAFLGDQNAGKHGIFAPFFGLQASTFPFPETMAGRFDVPLWGGWALRERRGVFRVHLQPLGRPAGDGLIGKTDHIDAYHRMLEAGIVSRPEQYNWAHRRWRTRPSAEEPGASVPPYATGATGRRRRRKSRS